MPDGHFYGGFRVFSNGYDWCGGAGLEEISDKVIRDKVLRNIYR